MSISASEHSDKALRQRGLSERQRTEAESWNTFIYVKESIIKKKRKVD